MAIEVFSDRDLSVVLVMAMVIMRLVITVRLFTRTK